MGGCADCKSGGGGCESHKGPQRVVIDDVMRAVYPDRTWGRPDDEARFRAGIREREARGLGRSIATAAKAPTYFRAGGPDDLCHYVWVLCLGREPALARRARRPGARPRPITCASAICASICRRWRGSRPSRRWRSSSIAPATAGCCASCRSRASTTPSCSSACAPSSISSRPATSSTSTSGSSTRPIPDATAGEYVERYGVEPALVNFLFYAQPARTSATILLHPNG